MDDSDVERILDAMENRFGEDKMLQAVKNKALRTYMINNYLYRAPDLYIKAMRNMPSRTRATQKQKNKLTLGIRKRYR